MPSARPRMPSSGDPRRVLCAGYDAGGLNLIAAMLRFWSGDEHIEATFVSSPGKVAALISQIPGLKTADWAETLTDDGAFDLAANAAAVTSIKKSDVLFVSTSLTHPLER